MEQEPFTQDQLLKSNDGKEYVIFKFYLNDNRRCEECMPSFRGKALRVGRLSEVKRATENFHVVSDAERQFVDDAIKYRNEAASTLLKARHELQKAKEREVDLKVISELDKLVESIFDLLDGMTKGIDDVIRYTAKDYIKGETVKKDLDNIRVILRKIRRVTNDALSDDCF